MIHRETAVVKTEPVSQVKEEPNSATNVEQRPGKVEEEQQRDVKPLIGDNSNVIVMQQQPQQQQQAPPAPLQQSTDDFENDPEAGPSGLQRATPNGSTCNQQQTRRYPIDFSDDDDDESVDEREIWRPPAAFRFARTQDDPHFINDQWIPYDQDDQATNNDSSNFSDLAAQLANKNKNPTDEVIDLSENDSNATVQNAPTNEQQPNCSHEVLTAPDLQLDWLSDSSSDNEIVCTIHDRNASSATKKSQSSNVSVENDDSDVDDDVPAIDLTASDDEEISFARDDSSNVPELAIRWSRNILRNNFPHSHYRSLMRASSCHDDNNRNDR